MRRFVIIAGAQALGACPRAYAWVDVQLQALMLELSRVEGALVVTGGSPGPEVWAEALASTFGVACVAYLPDGTRRDLQRGDTRWHDGELLRGSAATVRRDRVMLERAVRAVDAGDAVQLLAYLEPDASERSSSATRARLAEDKGISVDYRVWGARAEAAE